LHPTEIGPIFTIFGRFQNIMDIFQSIFERVFFWSVKVAIFISSTLSALQISALRSPLYALCSPLYAHIRVSSIPPSLPYLRFIDHSLRVINSIFVVVLCMFFSHNVLCVMMYIYMTTYSSQSHRRFAHAQNLVPRFHVVSLLSSHRK
jgi:hypothetical protein